MLSSNNYWLQLLKKTRKILGVPLFLGAFWLIAHVIYKNWSEISDAFSSIKTDSILLAILFSVLMLITKGIYNERIIAYLENKSAFNWLVIKSYVKSQIVRYLPGKIWGVIYQSAQVANHIPPKVIAAGNLLQFVYTNIFTFLVITSIYCLYTNSTVLFFLTLSLSVMFLIFIQMGSKTASTILKTSDLSDSSISSDLNNGIQFQFSLLVIDWIFYILIWWCIVGTNNNSLDFLYLAALYSSASIIAIIAAFSPGGIAVREAIFLLLGAKLGYDQETLIVYGLIARVIITAAEIILVALFMGIKVQYAK